jgi:hypothetical protein
MRAAGVPYLVHVSSSAVNSAAQDDYSTSKARQEELVRASGIRHCVLRLSAARISPRLDEPSDELLGRAVRTRGSRSSSSTLGTWVTRSRDEVVSYGSWGGGVRGPGWRRQALGGPVRGRQREWCPMRPSQARGPPSGRALRVIAPPTKTGARPANIQGARQPGSAPMPRRLGPQQSRRLGATFL